jgi:hypothetical protein
MTGDEHRVQPVWQSMQGQRYCGNRTAHGEYVLWPCDQAEEAVE